ncbi:MAG: DUF6496 domain-containing protein [Bauldia sp.]
MGRHRAIRRACPASAPCHRPPASRQGAPPAAFPAPPRSARARGPDGRVGRLHGAGPRTLGRALGHRRPVVMPADGLRASRCRRSVTGGSRRRSTPRRRRRFPVHRRTAPRSPLLWVRPVPGTTLGGSGHRRIREARGAGICERDVPARQSARRVLTWRISATRRPRKRGGIRFAIPPYAGRAEPFAVARRFGSEGASRRYRQPEKAGKSSSPRKTSKSASSDVKRAMHERKRGTLKSGGSGKTVTSRKQAIAIGLSEARAKGKKVAKKPAGKK